MNPATKYKIREILIIVAPYLSFITLCLAVYLTYTVFTYRQGWDAALKAVNYSLDTRCNPVNISSWRVP